MSSHTPTYSLLPKAKQAPGSVHFLILKCSELYASAPSPSSGLFLLCLGPFRSLAPSSPPTLTRHSSHTCVKWTFCTIRSLVLAPGALRTKSPSSFTWDQSTQPLYLTSHSCASPTARISQSGLDLELGL